MAKIAIDARELSSSTGRYVERLLHYLQDIDHKNRYLVLLKPADFENWQPKAANFEKVLCRYKEFTFGEQLGFWRQLKSLRPDLVHFAMTQQPVLYKGRVVTTIHDLTTARFRNPAKNPIIFWLKQQVYKWVIKRVSHKSTSLITPSQFVKDDVAQYTRIPSNTILVTYPAADKITGQAEPVMELEDKVFLLYVGRAQPHKNLKRLIDAHQQLLRKHPHLQLVLAGKTDDTYRLLHKYTSQKKVDGVVFTDFVSDAQLRWLYEHAKVYVFPSLSEGFGLPGLEAMLYDLPVISSNSTCLPEIYGDAAHYFDPKDVEDMASKISDVLDNPKLREELIAKGQKQAAKYSWQRMAKQTLEVYEQALAAK